MMDAPLETGATGQLILFVAGDSPNSRAALANLRRTLSTLGGSEEDLEIIDVFERPDLASIARVLVTPTLLRRSDPHVRILGDLSSTQQLLAFLQ
jgi:hypothetical protein